MKAPSKGWPMLCPCCPFLMLGVQMGPSAPVRRSHSLGKALLVSIVMRMQREKPTPPSALLSAAPHRSECSELRRWVIACVQLVGAEPGLCAPFGRATNLASYSLLLLSLQVSKDQQQETRQPLRGDGTVSHSLGVEIYSSLML